MLETLPLARLRELPGGFMLDTTPPIAFIHNRINLKPLSIIGIYSGAVRKLGIAPFPHPGPGDPSFQGAHFSTAQLENVAQAHIFYGGENGICRGVLLEYENGGQRALGQCRLNVDRVNSCTKPARICFFRTSYFRARTEIQLKAIKVEFLPKFEQHHHVEEGWICSEMAGELDFWFSHEESDVSVIVTE